MQVAEGHWVKGLGIEEEKECNNLMGRVEADDLVTYFHSIQNTHPDRIQNRTAVRNSNRYSSKNHMFVLRTYCHNLTVAMVMEVGKAASIM